MQSYGKPLKSQKPSLAAKAIGAFLVFVFAAPLALWFGWLCGFTVNEMAVAVALYVAADIIATVVLVVLCAAFLFFIGEAFK